MQVGILALQGDFAMHAKRLTEIGCGTHEVRTESDLASACALVIPGGESTVLLKLLAPTLRQAILGRHAEGMPILATCAGLILLARDVEPVQDRLAILDIAVERNAFGRQVDSFIDDDVRWTDAAREELRHIRKDGFDRKSLQGVFIRAPRITAIGRGVTVLAKRGEEPVLIRQGRVLGATFHPELTSELYEVHRMFLAEAGFH